MTSSSPVQSQPKWPRARLAELDASAAELAAAGDWPALLACMEEATEIAATSIGDNGVEAARRRDATAQLCCSLASRRLIDDQSAARELLQVAQASATQTSTRALAMSTLANLYRYQGEHEQALEALEQAAGLVRPVENWQKQRFDEPLLVAQTAIALGICCTLNELGHHAEALQNGASLY